MRGQALVKRVERLGADADLDAPFASEDVMALVILNDAEIELIASYKQGSPEWMLAHWLRIGGSNIGAVAGINPHKSRALALRDIVFGQRPFTNDAMTFGSKMESYSRLQYIAHRGGALYERFAQHYGINPDDMMHNRVLGSKRPRPTSFQSMLRQLDGEPAAAAAASDDEPIAAKPNARAAPPPAFIEPDFRVEAANFTIFPRAKHLGASPDGIVLYTDPVTGVAKRGILEIKTRRGGDLALDFSNPHGRPHAHTHANASLHVPAPDNIPHHYFAQCVLNMAIQRASFADFVVCNTSGLEVTTINMTPDVERFWNELYHHVTRFYKDAVIPAAVDALNGVIHEDSPLDTYVARALRGPDAVEVADARHNATA